MITSIIKRDGRRVPFDSSRIRRALARCFREIKITPAPGVMEDLVHQVVQALSQFDESQITVEHTQDIVEDLLIANGQAKAAKAYILYRAERTKAREARLTLMHDIHEITFCDPIDSEIQRENANINAATSMGTMLKYGSTVAKYYNLTQLIPPEIAQSHLRGDIHIHDLDFYTQTLTCCQIDILELLARGFNTGHGYIRSPQSIRAYASLACIAIQSNQNDMHGGQSIPNFDYGMAPGVRLTFINLCAEYIASCGALLGDYHVERLAKSIKDELKALNYIYTEFHTNPENHAASFITSTVVRNAILNVLKQADISHMDIDRFTDRLIAHVLKRTREETFQAMEALVHNLNSMHSRAGAQVPFSSINFGTDITAEGRMVSHALLDATAAGLGDGETLIFPISIFKLKSGVNYNPTDPNYDLFEKSCKVSASRMFPNFENLDAPYNLQYYKPGDYNSEVATMGCRTRVMGNVAGPEVTCGRGNLSFTTINLPRLGILAHGDWDQFYRLLDERLELVKNQLLHRYEIQCDRKVSNFPFLMGEGLWIDSDKLAPTDTIRDIVKHGTLSIGFIGLAEALVAMMGVHHGESEEAQERGLGIIRHMREFTDRMTEKYHLNFTTLGTPAEGLSGRFIAIDQERFGMIPGVTDKEYYTNSSHVPVYYPISACKKIAIEAPYHELENAGHICYVELDGDPSKNVDAFMAIVRYMHDQNVGYGAINHPIDRDPVCGYNGIIDNNCPGCGRTEDDGPEFDRIRRITGYLVGTLDRFNGAKRAEERDRVKHSTNDVDI